MGISISSLNLSAVLIEGKWEVHEMHLALLQGNIY